MDMYDFRMFLRECIKQGQYEELVKILREENIIQSEERPQGKWIITSEDTEGIHHIECPFCKYEKGSDFEPYIRVTFDKLPPFCEKCGADLRGKES